MTYCPACTRFGRSLYPSGTYCAIDGTKMIETPVCPHCLASYTPSDWRKFCSECGSSIPQEAACTTPTLP